VTAGWSYTYDLLQRLTSATSTGSRSYTYDDFGKLTSIGVECGLHDCSWWHHIMAIAGFGKAKATALVAALELGRRMATAKSKDTPRFRDFETAGEYLVSLLQDEQREMCTKSARFADVVEVTSHALHSQT
jgi:hypothetical protein